MKALVKFGSQPEEIALREAPTPSIGDDEVLLAVEATGICGTDLHIIAGEYPCWPPVILGHEFVGRIAEVGRGVQGYAVGDRVASLPYARYCGVCRHCRAGEYGQCDQRRSYGSGVNGGFAEYMAVRSSGLYRLPENQDFVAGSMTEPLACVARAVYAFSSLPQHPEHYVMVLGPGQIGLLTVQVAAATGAEVSLVGMRRDEKRLQLGRTVGAKHIFYADDPDMLQAIADTVGPDRIHYVFECSGAPPAFTSALKIVRRQGEVIQVGLFGKPVTAELDLIVFKDLHVRGSFASDRKSWEKALELTGSGQVNTAALISNTFPLQEWETAFQVAGDKSGLKVVIRPSQAA
jgi:L-iditol 2-dehydrogenase